MSGNWNNCKNILVIRPDNMGDLIMSGPAIRALKKTFGARITVLTSTMAGGIAAFMDEIDEVITFNFPWVKNVNSARDSAFFDFIERIRSYKFDAAVVFTVYSQSPIASVMLAYLAGIPKRLAYFRENPYQLLTNWEPDMEPYTFIKHQVQRDLDLVASVGAICSDIELRIQINTHLWPAVKSKLERIGLNTGKPWLILHAGVSEQKREFSKNTWIASAKQFRCLGYQIIFTGSKSEKQLTDWLATSSGENTFSAGGLFKLDELITLIAKSTLVISVNTGTVHIAAATQTPVVVLYALTNPQHTPWQTACRVLPYQIDHALHSKNEVIKFVNRYFYRNAIKYPGVAEIDMAAKELLACPDKYRNQQLCLIELMQHVSI